MNTERKVYLVCYDISDEKRLPKVYKIVRGYGDRIQYSVFRCVLSDVQRATLEARLLCVLKQGEDQVLFLLLGGVDSRTTWRVTALGKPVPDLERKARVV